MKSIIFWIVILVMAVFVYAVIDITQDNVARYSMNASTINETTLVVEDQIGSNDGTITGGVYFSPTMGEVQDLSNVVADDCTADGGACGNVNDGDFDTFANGITTTLKNYTISGNVVNPTITWVMNRTDTTSVFLVCSHLGGGGTILMTSADFPVYVKTYANKPVPPVCYDGSSYIGFEFGCGTASECDIYESELNYSTINITGSVDSTDFATGKYGTGVNISDGNLLSMKQDKEMENFTMTFWVSNND